MGPWRKPTYSASSLHLMSWIWKGRSVKNNSRDSALHHPSGRTVNVDLSVQLCEMELPWPFRLRGAGLMETDLTLVIQQRSLIWDNFRCKKLLLIRFHILSFSYHLDISIMIPTSTKLLLPWVIWDQPTKYGLYCPSALSIISFLHIWFTWASVPKLIALL